MNIRHFLGFLATCGLAGTAHAQVPSYANDVHPILAERCYSCHGGEERRAGFSMNTRESFLAGGEFGPTVVPGESGESLLIELVTSEDSTEWMPPKGERLSGEQVAILRAWIDGGLPWDAPENNLGGWKAPLGPRSVETPKERGIHGSDHPIDRFIAAYFNQQGTDAPELVDDRRFARRAYLDIIGLLPTEDAVETFASSRKRNKYDTLVGDLLADRRSYAEHWITFWNDALRNDFKGTGYIDGGRKQITGWLYDALAENTPYDAFTRELIAPSREAEGFIGGIKWRGAETANQQISLQAARSVSEVFLGVNLKCASCHDSFVDEWKLGDAYGFANAFSESPLELVRCDVPTGQVAETRFLWPELGEIDADTALEDRRRRVAELVTSADNGRYARVLVNRVWYRLMGRGLVEPHASLDAEPWNADLLDWLATEFAAQGYDVQQLIRLIATSRAYRLNPDTRPPAEGDYAFAGPIPRRLTAEQFYDAMSCVTGLWQSEPQYAPRPHDDSRSTSTVRAWRIPADELMRALGRPNREQIMLARETQYTRLQALELTNGGALAEFIARGAERLTSEGAVDPVALFAHALGRAPEAAERAILLEFGTDLDRVEPVEDVLWMLFNHPEFQMVF